MKRIACAVLAVALSLSLVPGRLMGQPAITVIVGMVGTIQGQPVPGVKIAARDPSGKIVSEAATDLRGQYALQNLTPGRYQLTLDPLNSPFKGQTVASAVGAEGLTVDWVVSAGADALAMATPGVGGTVTTGLAPETTGALIFLAGSGVTLGLTAGFIGFDGNANDRRRVGSPSQ